MPLAVELGWERDLDEERPVLDVRRMGAAPLVVIAKAPGTVQGKPLRPLQLRPGVSGLQHTSSFVSCGSSAATE
jgi:hypothetical protein